MGSAQSSSTHKVNEKRSIGKEKYANFDWDNLGFSLTPTDYMYIMKSNKDGNFSKGSLTPYGTFEISPAAAVLNYGQGLFEGLKAYRKEDGRIQLFRVEENANRMKMGAERLLMPSPSVEEFVNAVKQTVLANKRWVPPYGKGSLYIRPLLMGSGGVLGIGPAPECTFLIFTSPIGIWYKDGSKPKSLLIEDGLSRAAPGGTGGVKSITNYAPVFEAVNEAKAKGFTDVLFLDAATGKYIEEVSSCNVFIVKGNIISTPGIQGTILPGITRKSVIELALDFGYQVEERSIPVEDVIEADEVFCTGTAVGISPVSSITYKNKRAKYKTGAKSVSQKLCETLTGIQSGCIKDTKGWTVLVE
ncbi:Branched-chain-amino-acid aminotransferase [Quillaja saponaria]|uniref:Branched-chain-amino-acid aminotransferase n=1 Tax=Quillaja saponaria TaxID=32244 RepID=A0AAD7M1T2_QUISA|nr:Branched-chain-amino-acid aminotransferase [Quillaja saponaria]